MDLGWVSCRSKMGNGSLGGSGRPRKTESSLVPGKIPWAWQGAWRGPEGKPMGPIHGDIPIPVPIPILSCVAQQRRLLCHSPQHDGGIPTARGKLVIASDSKHQGKLRHGGLHTCHDTETRLFVQLSPTTIAPPVSLT